MSSTIVYAFLAVAVAPFIGIWRAHSWAKQSGFVLRKRKQAEAEAV